MNNAISKNDDLIVQNDLGRKRAIVKVGNGYETLVELEPGVWGYGAIVAALVKSRYTNDEMQAIVNNHLLGDDNLENEQEYDDMQEWRRKCKARAKELLALGEDMGLTYTDNLITT